MRSIQDLTDLLRLHAALRENPHLSDVQCTAAFDAAADEFDGRINPPAFKEIAALLRGTFALVPEEAPVAEPEPAPAPPPRPAPKSARKPGRQG
ncbi:hypothetical protein [Roseomonas sp. WA12]